MKTSDLYPYVHNQWLLFHQSDGAYLKHSGEDGAYLTGDVWELSDLAVKILLMCDGSQTVTEILTHIYNTCEAKQFSTIDSAANFLSEAMQNKIIGFSDKSEKHIIAQRGNKDNAYPLHFAIELTDACNLKCKHCYRDSSPGLSNRLPTERLLSVLNDLHENGVHSIELSGGEPTYHPDFLEILAFSLSHFGAVALLTNGTLMNKAIYNLLEQYRQKAIVQIDLDGCNAQEHENLRGLRGSFDKACSAIEELSRRGVRVRVAMSIHSGNYNSIKETYQIAKKLGAKWFTCSPILDIGRANENMLLTWEQLQGAVNCIDELGKQDPDFMLTASELKRLSGKLGSNCGAGSRSVALGPDGQIRPCFLVNKLIPSFKNIQSNSLNEVIRQAPLSFMRNLEPPCPEICGDCPHTVFCYGCIARPLIAWDRMRKKGDSFKCNWDAQTGFSKQLGLS